MSESCSMPGSNPENQAPQQAKKDNDTAREDALAAQFSADRERFKMTREQIEELCRSVRRLFIIEGKMTQGEYDEIDKQFAAEKIQKENEEGNGKEAGE